MPKVTTCVPYRPLKNLGLFGQPPPGWKPGDPIGQMYYLTPRDEEVFRQVWPDFDPERPMWDSRVRPELLRRGLRADQLEDMTALDVVAMLADSAPKPWPNIVLNPKDIIIIRFVQQADRLVLLAELARLITTEESATGKRVKKLEEAGYVVRRTRGVAAGPRKLPEDCR